MIKPDRSRTLPARTIAAPRLVAVAGGVKSITPEKAEANAETIK